MTAIRNVQEADAVRCAKIYDVYVQNTCISLEETPLSAIEAKAKEQGITNIVSIITDENENSVRFHEKHGFKQEGYLHGVAVKFGKQVGVYYYSKPL